MQRRQVRIGACLIELFLITSCLTIARNHGYDRYLVRGTISEFTLLFVPDPSSCRKSDSQFHTFVLADFLVCRMTGERKIGFGAENASMLVSVLRSVELICRPACRAGRIPMSLWRIVRYVNRIFMGPNF